MVKHKPKANQELHTHAGATHGQPSKQNAHPHDSHEEIFIVHNGIIENHSELKRQLPMLVTQ